MLDNLTNRLSGVIKTLRGHARLTEDNIADAMREVRMALLEADVALPVVKNFVASVKERALGQEVMGSLTPGQAIIGVVHEELVKLMGAQNDALNLAAVPPAMQSMSPSARERMDANFTKAESFDAERKKTSRLTGRRSRYRLEVGKRDGVSPKAIVGAITNEAGIRGDSLGKINIYPSFTVVEIDRDLDEAQMSKVSRATGSMCTPLSSKRSITARHCPGTM